MAMRNKISPEKPHFFKPVLPGFKDGVKIPKFFLKYLDGKISQNQAVLRRGGQEWRVKINDQCLREGWRAFAVENKLHVGDFVVFQHQGNMVFEVLVFDPSHCERQFPSIDDNGKGGSEKSKAAAKEGLSTRISGQQLSSHDQEPGNPQFISTIEPHCIKRHILYFPVEFARSNNLSDRSCNLILRDPKKRVWHVELKARGRRGYIFGHGLDEFFTANGLKEGDTCKFELVENGETPIIYLLTDLTKDDQPQPQPQSPPQHQPLSFMKTNSKDKAKRLEASSEPENDDHTYFVSAIRPYNLKKYVLHLPIKFAEQNGLTKMKGDMILKDDKQRPWKIKFEHRANSGVMLSRGLGRFFKANGLKVGNRFKFEIIKKGKRPVVNFHCNFSEI